MTDAVHMFGRHEPPVNAPVGWHTCCPLGLYPAPHSKSQTLPVSPAQVVGELSRESPSEQLCVTHSNSPCQRPSLPQLNSAENSSLPRYPSLHSATHVAAASHEADARSSRPTIVSPQLTLTHEPPVNA